MEDSRAIEFVSTKLKGDKEIALCAIAQDPNSIKFVSERIKRDKGLQVYLTPIMKMSLEGLKNLTMQERKRLYCQQDFRLTSQVFQEATSFTSLLKNSKWKLQGIFTECF